MAKYITNDFYCINCGNPTLPVARKIGNAREKFHRKKLWCYHCKTEINCVEVKNQEEKELFKEMYSNGDFKAEATESICACRYPLGRTY